MHGISSLPLTAMLLSAFATTTLLTKNSFLDEIRKQYVTTARAKGLSERKILYGHVFRNAMLIVISGFPSAFISIFFTGQLLIEAIFSLDGWDCSAIKSIINRDYPVVIATVYIFALVGVVVSLLSDLTLHVDRSADRFRAEGRLMTSEVLRAPARTPGSTLHACRRSMRAAGRISRPTAAAGGRCGYSSFLFIASLFAEFIANDRPILVSYKGEILFPVLVDYPEEKFGGFYAVTDYRDPVIQDEINANGWAIWPPVRYSYRTVNNELPDTAPSKPLLAIYAAKSAAPVIRKGSAIRIASSAI